MSYPKINILGTADFGNSQIQNVALHVATGIASPINAQIYLSSTDNIVYCYNSTSGTFFPLTNVFSMARGGTSPTGQVYIVGSGSTLSYSNSGNVDANLFKHNSIVAIADGGTASTGFDTYGVAYYDGSALITSSTFGYDPSVKGLRLRSSGTPSGVLHIGAGTGPLAYVTPMDRLATAMKNSLEYNGTGWFFTDNFGISYRVATTGMSLTSFTGTVPIANGGTNTTSFTSQGLIKYNGSALTSFLGTNIGEVAYWDGSQWTSSSGSFVSLVPDSASRNTIQSPTGSYYPLLIRGASGQTTYFRIENFQNTPFFRVTNVGVYTATDLLLMDTVNNNLPNTNAYIWMESDAPSGYSNPYIELRPNGGVGGYIKITGGGNTSKSGGHLNLSGGAGVASAGGTIDLTGGSAAGAQGGSIDLSGAGSNARGGVFTLRGGGSNNASGGVWDGAGNSLPGGHVITRDGGGSINTNSGFIQLGQAGNRTTLFTMPTGTASFTFPRSTGYIATSTVPYATGYAYWNGTGVLIATGVSVGGGPGATTLDDLTDVATAGQVANDYLRFNGSLWVPSGSSPGGSIALDDLTDVNTAGEATGNYLRFNGTSWIPASLDTSGLAVLSANNTYTGTNTFSGNKLILGDVTFNKITAKSYSSYWPQSPYGSSGWILFGNTETAASGYWAISVGSGTVGYLSRNLENISNVVTGVLSSGQVLTYNGSNWVNAAPSGGTWGDVYLANKNIFTNQNIFNSSGITILSPNGSSSGILAKANGASNYTAILPDSQGNVYFVTQSAYGSSGFLAVALGSGSVSYINNKISSIGDTSINTASSGQSLIFNGNYWCNADPISQNLEYRTISATFFGTPISSGQVSETLIPYSGAIVDYTILTQSTGSIQFTIDCTGFSAYPNLSSIIGTNKPTLTNSRSIQSNNLSTWTSGFSQNSIFRFSVASGDNSIVQATIILKALIL